VTVDDMLAALTGQYSGEIHSGDCGEEDAGTDGGSD